MAGAAEKKRQRENAAKLATLRGVVLAGLLLPALAALARGGAGRGYWVALALTGALSGLCYRWLAGTARHGGSLSNARATELGGGGAGAVTEHLEDSVYVIGFAQVLTIFTRWGWLALLVIPAYLGFLGAKRLLTWVFNPTAEERLAAMEETPEMRKKREKAERRANRVKYRR